MPVTKRRRQQARQRVQAKSAPAKGEPTATLEITKHESFMLEQRLKQGSEGVKEPAQERLLDRVRKLKFKEKE